MFHKLTTLFLLLSLPLLAQDSKPNFSGTWLCKMKYYRERDRINHNDPEFRISEVVGRADIIYELVFQTDGRYLEQDRGAVNVVRTGRWEGQTLILETKLTRDGAVSTTREEFSLSEDGKVMTKIVHFSGSHGKRNQNLEFQKMPDN